MLRSLPLGDETERMRVGIALEEALFNAYYHGNLEIGSGLGREEFDELAVRRSRDPEYHGRRIHVRARISREEAAFVVRDDGPGFDPAEAVSQDDDIANQTSGRGLRLIRAVMDEVSFNDAGNEITMTKRRVVEDDDLPEG